MFLQDELPSNLRKVSYRQPWGRYSHANVACTTSCEGVLSGRGLLKVRESLFRLFNLFSCPRTCIRHCPTGTSLQIQVDPDRKIKVGKENRKLAELLQSTPTASQLWHTPLPTPVSTPFPPLAHCPHTALILIPTFIAAVIYFKYRLAPVSPWILYQAAPRL